VAMCGSKLDRDHIYELCLSGPPKSLPNTVYAAVGCVMSKLPNLLKDGLFLACGPKVRCYHCHVWIKTGPNTRHEFLPIWISKGFRPKTYVVVDCVAFEVPSSSSIVSFCRVEQKSEVLVEIGSKAKTRLAMGFFCSACPK
jgi:hypothetical protein